MRSKVLSLCVVLAFITFGCKPKEDRTSWCLKWQEGKYIYEDQDLKYLIERKDNIQTETDLATRDYSRYKVIWINDCIYRLYFYEGPQYLKDIWEGQYMEVTILSDTEDAYTIKSTFSANPDKQEVKTLKVSSD